MTKLEQILDKIKSYKYIFINNEIKASINDSINNVFPKLNSSDKMFYNYY